MTTFRKPTLSGIPDNDPIKRFLSFTMEAGDRESPAYKAGWKAWEDYMKSPSFELPENPYSTDDRQHYVWLYGFRENNCGL